MSLPMGMACEPVLMGLDFEHVLKGLAHYIAYICVSGPGMWGHAHDALAKILTNLHGTSRPDHSQWNIFRPSSCNAWVRLDTMLPDARPLLPRCRCSITFVCWDRCRRPSEIVFSFIYIVRAEKLSPPPWSYHNPFFVWDPVWKDLRPFLSQFWVHLRSSHRVVITYFPYVKWLAPHRVSMKYHPIYNSCIQPAKWYPPLVSMRYHPLVSMRYHLRYTAHSCIPRWFR